MSFALPKLSYPYNALEPHFDAQSMEVHHSKHHQAYTDKLNDALADQPDLAGQSAEDIIANLNTVPGEIRTAVRNNGGGYINHSLFWQVLAPANERQEKPNADLAQAIDNQFNNYDSFVDQFNQAATTHFGSGWAWLVVDGNDQLQITTTVNQDSPLTSGNTPILTLDLWEHSYYLKYQNRRPEYIAAFWNVINWEEVQRRYTAALPA